MKLSTALTVLLAVLAPPAVVASAADLEWNQDRVAQLARDLDEPVGALIADLEKRPPVPGKEAARAAVMNALERLQLRAGELAQRIAGGAGQGDTVALFREVEALQSEAAKLSLEYPAPFDMHVYTDQVQRITIQLARYYGQASDPLDGSQQ